VNDLTNIGPVEHKEPWLFFDFYFFELCGILALIFTYGSGFISPSETDANYSPLFRGVSSTLKMYWWSNQGTVGLEDTKNITEIP